MYFTYLDASSPYHLNGVPVPEESSKQVNSTSSIYIFMEQSSWSVVLAIEMLLKKRKKMFDYTPLNKKT